MVTATSPDGIKRRLILNEEVILVKQKDTITFFMVDEKLEEKLTFNFKFDEATNIPYDAHGDISPDGNTIDITLRGWDNVSGVFLNSPYELTTTSGKRLWVMIHVSLSDITKTRKFHISIWGEE